MSDLIRNSEDNSERSIDYYKFEFHTDEAGVRQRVASTPTLSFIEVGGEAPAEEVRDEEPVTPEPAKKALFVSKKDTQKGVN